MTSNNPHSPSLYHSQTLPTSTNSQPTYNVNDFAKYRGFSQVFNQKQLQLQPTPYHSLQNYNALGNAIAQSYNLYSEPTKTSTNQGCYYGNCYGNTETTTDINQKNLQRYSQYLNILQKHYGIRLPEETSSQQVQNSYPNPSQYGFSTTGSSLIYGQPTNPVNIYEQSVVQPTIQRPNNPILPQPIIQPQSPVRPWSAIQNNAYTYMNSRESDLSKTNNLQGNYISSQGTMSKSIYGAGQISSGVTSQGSEDKIDEEEYESNHLTPSTLPPTTQQPFTYTTQQTSTQSVNSVQGKGDTQPMITIAALTQQVCLKWSMYDRLIFLKLLHCISLFNSFKCFYCCTNDQCYC